MKSKKKAIFILIIAVVICIHSGTLLSNAATLISGSAISFSNTASGSTKNNVQDAIDDLYKRTESGKFANMLPLLYINSQKDTQTASGTTINVDLSGYDYILVDLYSSGTSVINLLTKSSESQRVFTSNNGSSWANYRDMVVTNSGITLGAVFSQNGTNTNVNVYRIWGIKNFDLLWTNSSPTTAMNSGTKISIDLTNYHYVLVDTYINGNNVTTLIKKNELSQVIFGNNGNSWGAFRNITEIDDSGITLGAGKSNNAASNYVNPYKIYGIKDVLG